MQSITTNLLDASKMAELGLCPICKVNYITEDETVCSTCLADTDLTDEELVAMYGDKHHDDDEEDEDDDQDDEELMPVDEEDGLGLAEDEVALLEVTGIDNNDGIDENDDDEPLDVDPLEEDLDDEDELDDGDFDLDDDDDDDFDDDDDDKKIK